jgi:large subunit ribosomal protein L35
VGLPRIEGAPAGRSRQQSARRITQGQPRLSRFVASGGLQAEAVLLKAPQRQSKCLQAIKTRTWVPWRLTGTSHKEHQHAQDEDQEQREKAFSRPGGTVKRGQAFKRHILTKKTTKNKRQLRGAVNVHETNMGHIAQMLPFAGL